MDEGLQIPRVVYGTAFRCSGGVNMLTKAVLGGGGRAVVGDEGEALVLAASDHLWALDLPLSAHYQYEVIASNASLDLTGVGEEMLALGVIVIHGWDGKV